MTTSPRPIFRSSRSSRSSIRRSGAIVVVALFAALVVEGWAVRLARACGEPEIDYGPDKPVLYDHPGQREIRLNFRRKEHSFNGGNLNLSEVRVFTRDGRFLTWLEKHGMGVVLWSRLKAATSKTSCTELTDGRRIARLEQTLASQVAEAYRRATRRTTPRPDLMLVAEVLDQSEPTCTSPSP